MNNPSTPYERILWQQENCTDRTGYAVAIVAPVTERAAYMTGNGLDITNDEREAAILSKPEASILMTNLYSSDNWFKKLLYKSALLVPVSETKPLTLCTFQGR